MNYRKRLGGLIGKHLAESGMTQENFAEKMGVSPGTPSNWINGHRTFPLNKIPALCTALGIDQKSAEREGLETEAYLSRAPVEVRKLVDSLEARLAKSEQEAVRLDQGLIESERKAVRLSQTLAKLRQAMISAGIQVPEVDLDI